jgi:hypothetical protein
MKTTRCVRCAAEFSDEELNPPGCAPASCCPNCGTKSTPCLLANDVTIKINTHELRILGIWAENHAVTVDNRNLDNAQHESMKETVNLIAERIRAQLPKRDPLTLSQEVKELQNHAVTSGGDVTLIRDGREEIL